MQIVVRTNKKSRGTKLRHNTRACYGPQTIDRQTTHYVCMYVCGFISRNPYTLSSHEARP